MAAFPITVLCRALDVSRAAFYAWVYRPPSAHTVEDQKLAGEDAVRPLGWPTGANLLFSPGGQVVLAVSPNFPGGARGKGANSRSEFAPSACSFWLLRGEGDLQEVERSALHRSRGSDPVELSVDRLQSNPIQRDGAEIA